MIDLIRMFLVLLEEGSMNRAAKRLRVSQPTLTRQLQALEAELGGSLVERGNWGVRPTDLGFLLRDRMRSILLDYDAAWSEVQAAGQGKVASLRIGYLGLSASRFLNPILQEIREACPEVQLALYDLTPAEQLDALAKGELDVAMIGQEGATGEDRYHRQTMAELPLCAAVPVGHRLSKELEAPFADFAGERFVGAPDAHVPGRNAWISKLCAKAGFKAKFTRDATSLGESFSIVLSDSAISLLPDYVDGSPPPGVVYVRISDPDIRWKYTVMRQAGKGTNAARKTVDLLLKLGRSYQEATEEFG
ncbi:MAG: LysR family transcriptional regulator [Verrucomicrobiota bacterium]